MTGLCRDRCPVGIGLITSLARPDENITGLSNLNPELSGKQLELLKETVPQSLAGGGAVERTSPRHPVVLKTNGSSAEDFDGPFQAATSERAQALMPLGDPLMNTQLKRILEFATKKRLPAVYSQNEYVEAGGLMSYGTDMPALFRRVATYVDKILKGDKPSDLPVE